MMETVLIVVAASITGYILLVGMSASVHPLSNFASFVGELFVRPFNISAERRDASARRRRIEDEIDRELGQSDPWGCQERADVIRATVQARRIRILDQKFRGAVRTCVRTHRSVAQGLGASHMSEAARHPLCAQLRERVIDLSETLSETIEEYPLLLDSPDLVKLHVGLPRIAPTCIECPYWTTSVAEAPQLCPPARAVGCQPENASSPRPVVDAEIVDPE
jgi:hypothetical protein